MGFRNQNNYIVEIRSHTDMSAHSIVEYVQNGHFSQKDYIIFLEKNKPFYHPLAEQLLNFILNYKSGLLYPDKWDCAEPLKELFNNDSHTDVIDCMVHPSYITILKKNRKYEVVIHNKSSRWCPVWFISGKGNSMKEELIKPVDSSLKYLTEIMFIFPSEFKQDLNFLQQLMEDFCKYLNTDYGVVYHQETRDVIFSYMGTIPFEE